MEGEVGGAEFGFEYPELQPVITAAGGGEATPSWDYEVGAVQRVIGSLGSQQKTAGFGLRLR